MVFACCNDLLAFSVANRIEFYNLKTLAKICDYEHITSTVEPANKKPKPCESRVDNQNVIAFDLRRSSTSEAFSCVAVYNDKTAKYLDKSGEIKVLHEWSLQKRPTSIKILEVGKGCDVVVVDKAGDAYRLLSETENLECSNETPILGHISMLLDLALTEKYLVTAERDEKIKITMRTRPVDIHGYLLGHTQFVKSVFPVNDKHLLSFGGDYTAKLWNLDTCEEIDSYDLPEDTIHVVQSSENCSHFTLITRDRSLQNFKISDDANKLVKVVNGVNKGEDAVIAVSHEKVLACKEIGGIPADFLTSVQVVEGFDKLFKNNDFTKY